MRDGRCFWGIDPDSTGRQELMVSLHGDADWEVPERSWQAVGFDGCESGIGVTRYSVHLYIETKQH